ncbi:MAG: hypothetical protein ACNA75_06755 [Thiohalomonadaceae bacterium]
MNRILLSLGLVITVLLLSACQTVSVRHHTPSVYVLAEHPVHHHQQIIVQQTQIQQTHLQHRPAAQLRHGQAPAPAARVPVGDPAPVRPHAPAPSNRPVHRPEAGPGRPVQGKPTSPAQREHSPRQTPERQTGPGTAARATPARAERGTTRSPQPTSPSPRTGQTHPRQAAQQQTQANTTSRSATPTPRGQAVAATAGEEEERKNPRRAR